MQGYIKLHRQLLDNPLFTSEPFTKGQAWITLLLLTNHKEGYITVKNGELFKIERGECGYSELALAKIFKWSRGKVKRFLNVLESQKMIQQKTRSNHALIKVLNYDNFQNDTINDTTNGQQTVQQTVQQTDINNNDKNDNNEKNILDFPKKKKVDPYSSQEILNIVEIYSANCKNLIPIKKYSLNRELRELIAEYLEETNCDYEYFNDVCIKADKLKQIGKYRLDLKSVIKNHAGIYGDKYIEATEEEDKPYVYNPCL